MPLVSVIIPVYNREVPVITAIASVMSALSSIDAEIIVVDDGSTDNTLSELNKYFGDESRMQIIKLPHNGRPAAVRNAGIRASSGEFIAFQDSDDVWINKNLAKSIELLANSPEVVMLYANAYYQFENEKSLRKKIVVQDHQALDNNAFYKLISKHPTPVPTPTVIVKRRLIDEIGLFNEELIFSEDTEYWIRASLAGKIIFENTTQAIIHRDGTNLSSTPYESGDEALLKHETGHIKMFEGLLKGVPTNSKQKNAIVYRIAELKQYINQISARQDIDEPYPEIVLPKMPEELALVATEYTKTLSGRVSGLLELLPESLGRTIKTILKKIVSPFRRVL